VKRHTLKRRYGRTKAGSGKVHTFAVIATKFGPTAVAYDYRGRSVNVINGTWGKDTIEDLYRLAKRHWPSAKEKR
jgi:hypothetical protein